jgi:hypothetical protein
MATMIAAGEFGQVVLCLLSDGQRAGRAPADIFKDIQAACLARPGLEAGLSGPEESEQLARVRASVLAEVLASHVHGRVHAPVLEVKLDLLIQVAKRDALIEAAKAEAGAK